MSRRRKRSTPPPPPPASAAPVAPVVPGRWAGVFALDARSLAAFRIGLGLWLLLDLVWRAYDLTAHYTDAGVLPRITRIGVYDLPPGSDRKYWLSLLMIAGDPLLVRGLFALGAVAYAAFLVGYRTRVAAVASYLFLCSLHARIPIVCDGGDVLGRVMLFWGLFLPLGGRFSLDVALGRRPPHPDRVRNLATVALVVQLMSVYLGGAAAKDHAVWHTDHTALYYALSVDAFATPVGRWLAPLHGLTRPLTFGVYWLEWLAPLALLLPVRTPWLRLGLVAAFWGFHLGTAVTLNLGLFPFVGCLAWVPVLPAAVWERGRWRVPSGGVGGATRLSWGATVAVAAVGGYVLLWNLREANPWWARVFPQSLTPVGRLLRVDQDWALFAPKPMTEDGWYVMEGTLDDGRVVNLWADGPLPTAKPADVADTYVNTRWRKYLLNLNAKEYEAHRLDFSVWLKLRWAEAHPNDPPVVRCELAFMREPTPLPGEPVPEAVRTVIFVGQDRPSD